ncbi:Kelch repeat-containing protein [Sorangium sp. So ce1128]
MGARLNLGAERRLARWAVLLLIVQLMCGLGCAAPAGGAPDVEMLEAQFEERARAVLRGGDALLPTEGGFELAPSPSRGGLALAFPSEGSGAVRFDLPGGFGVEVRELGLRGEGRKAGVALAYPRAGGFALWAAQRHGVEEWLWFPEGAPAGGPLASWQVEGARLRRRGANVEVLDAAGEPRIIVSAPEAYASPLRRIPTRLEVHGEEISLWVEETGTPLLVDPAWTVTAPSKATLRRNHTATLLPDGRVLVAGGLQQEGVFDDAIELASALVYDPALDAWLPAAPMSQARWGHTATLLPGGRVLVTGGAGTLATAELYDSTTDTWTPTVAMTAARWLHTATELADGRVLVAGGAAAATAEIYDPAADSWSPTPAMSIARVEHTATRLQDGRVLIAGGRSPTTVAFYTSVEIYDPTTGAWTPGPAMLSGLRQHTATLLEDGDVLVIGRGPGGQVYDPETNAWTPAGTLNVRRDLLTATRLCDGRVLVSGTPAFGYSVPPVELYDPSTGTFSPGLSGQKNRSAATATLLLDGRVLFVGGVSSPPGAEIYDPSATTPGTPIGPLNEVRNSANAVELADGKVLIAGGSGSIKVTELYDPSTMMISLASPLNFERSSPDVTRLADGRVLISGGLVSDYPTNNEIYDPAADAWTLTAPDEVRRYDHTATLLGSGEVLIAGGVEIADPYAPFVTDRTRSAALYRPADDTWVAVERMNVGRAEHAATLLDDGRVLVVGGSNGQEDIEYSSVVPLASAEIYDPASRSWSLVAPMGTPRSRPTATRLLDGRVLVVEPTPDVYGPDGRVLAIETTAEVYDPATNVWTPTGLMNSLKNFESAAVLLPTGEVLVIGGTIAQIYHPSTNAWTPAPSTVIYHTSPAAVLLPSGQVLILGTNRDAELYDPRWRGAGNNGCSSAGAGGAGGGEPGTGGMGGAGGGEPGAAGGGGNGGGDPGTAGGGGNGGGEPATAGGGGNGGGEPATAGVGGHGGGVASAGSGEAGAGGPGGGDAGAGGDSGSGGMSASAGSAGESSTSATAGSASGAGGSGGSETVAASTAASSSAAGSSDGGDPGPTSTSSGPGEGSSTHFDCNIGQAAPGTGAVAFYLAVAGAALERRLSRRRAGGRSTRARPCPG